MKLKSLISSILVIPLFFQLQGSIFSSRDMVYDSQHLITRLPIPFSVIACFLGIILLWKKGLSRFSLLFISLFGISMLPGFSLSFLSDGGTSKFVLMIQFLLPTFAFLLGASWKDQGHVFETAALVILTLIIPTQLVATIIQGKYPLTPWLYTFSIYQHLQYVPVILVGLFWWVSIALYEYTYPRRVIFLMIPIVSFYSAASMSIQTTGLCVIGCSGFVLLRGTKLKKLISIILTTVGLLMAIWHDNLRTSPIKTMHWSDKLGTTNSQSSPSTPDNSQTLSTLPPSVTERREIWKVYWSHFTKDSQTIFLGSPKGMERNLIPSAHNYFLDLIFNFGLLPLLPLVGLIFLTAIMFIKHLLRKQRSPSLLALGGLLFFLVLVNNSLTVALRQPYTGILTFFLWGLFWERTKSVEAISSTQSG